MGTEKDCWAEWVAKMRSAVPEEARRRGLDPYSQWRERILDNANFVQGETVLDVGCGEGLVAFGALARGAGEVVFSDVSQDLLEFCRDAATELGVLDRCRFVRAPANDLSAIEAGSVDVVTTRSVLIYVADKRAAFAEFARVLRSEGRISLFEPINRFALTERDTWSGYDLGAIPEISRKIRAVYEAIQPPDTDPMLDFDERDLLAFAEQAGFDPIQLTLEADIGPSEPVDWETFVDAAGNPRIPTFSDAINQALSVEERERLTAHLRPLVEGGRGKHRRAVAWLHATKP
ncbi:MAG: class I SAM-dependent methyltransferase [Gaiellaceae bacterium]